MACCISYKRVPKYQGPEFPPLSPLLSYSRKSTPILRCLAGAVTIDSYIWKKEKRNYYHRHVSSTPQCQLQKGHWRQTVFAGLMQNSIALGGSLRNSCCLLQPKVQVFKTEMTDYPLQLFSDLRCVLFIAEMQ